MLSLRQHQLKNELEGLISLLLPGRSSAPVLTFVSQIGVSPYLGNLADLEPQEIRQVAVYPFRHLFRLDHEGGAGHHYPFGDHDVTHLPLDFAALHAVFHRIQASETSRTSAAQPHHLERNEVALNASKARVGPAIHLQADGPIGFGHIVTSFHSKFIRKSNLRRLLAQRPESF